MRLAQVREPTELAQLLAQTPELLETAVDNWLTRQAEAAHQHDERQERIRWLAYRNVLAQYRKQGTQTIAHLLSGPPIPPGHDFILIISPLAHLLLYGGGQTHYLQARLAQAALQTILPQKEPDLWGVLHSARAEALLKMHGPERQAYVENALRSFQEALQVWQSLPSITCQQRSIVLQGLATAYRQRAAGSRKDNLKQALRCLEEALTVCPKSVDSELWADAQVGRAATLAEMPVVDHQIRQETIAAYEAALSVYTRELNQMRWAEITIDLANVYGDYPVAANLERAHALATAVLNQTPHSHLLWARSHVMLGNVLVHQPHGNRLENLATAVDHYKKALTALNSAVHPVDWARTCHNMATAFRRYPVQRSQHLLQAIEAYGQALTILSKSDYPYEWAQIQLGLGDVFSQPALPDRADKLEKAIDAYRQALIILSRENTPIAWATLQNNLGNAYADRIAGDRQENQQEAKHCYKSALQIRTKEKMPARWAETMNNLGTVHSEAVAGDRKKQLARAMYYMEEALTIHTPEQFPADARRAAWNLAQMHFVQRQWPQAATACATAVQAAENLYQAGGTTTARQTELIMIRNVAAVHAYSLARNNQLAEAVVALERGRARALREALSHLEASLEQVRPKDRQEFAAIQKQIVQLEAEARAVDGTTERTFVEIASALRQARQTLMDLTERICRYKPDFVAGGLEFGAISSVATAVKQPIVYLLVTYHGSLALIVPPASGKLTASQKDTVLPVWLDNFKEADLQHILYDRDDKRQYLHGITFSQSESNLIDVLNEAWLVLQTRLLAPLEKQLEAGDFPSAVLVPVGLLGLLPLPALCLNNITLAQAPSARALQSAIARAEEREGQSFHLLGVGNPARAYDPLPYARLELEEIVTTVGARNARPFYGHQATRQALMEAMPEATHLHFACHGTFHIERPLDSALYLANKDTITLKDLLDGKLDLSASRLVVLSACQTGITDFQNLPDEAIGFPAGFMQSGVPGVISTLWPVNDLSTKLLMTQFYKLYWSGLPPALALRKAQLWLRDLDLTVKDLVDLFEAYLEEGEEETGLPVEVASKEYHKYVHWADWDERPFAHPYYWAPFNYTGV